MKNQKIITILVVCIAVLVLAATLTGLLAQGGPGNYDFKTLHGETIKIYGKGLYQHESLKLGPQTRGQDAVSLFLGLPLLVMSLVKARQGSLKGRLLLAGTLGYFFYTYLMMMFIYYNPLFLVYIPAMAASMYAFILTLMSFDMSRLRGAFGPKLPVKYIVGFQVFVTLTLSVLWLSDLIPALINGTIPRELQHYSTLTVYALDLGFVVPALLIGSILLIKRNPYGYLMSAIMIVKSITILTALTAMGIAAMMEGVVLSLGDLMIFPLFNIGAVYAIYGLLKSIDENKYSEREAS